MGPPGGPLQPRWLRGADLLRDRERKCGQLRPVRGSPVRHRLREGPVFGEVDRPAGRGRPWGPPSFADLMTPPEQETLAMSQITDYSPQGHVARDLAARFGTPLYVYDADTLRSTYTALREGLHPGVDVFYSAKANPNISVCGLLRSMGAGMEVSSMAELVTALLAGTAPDDIIFLGPGKSRADLQATLDHAIYALVC